MKCLLHTSSKSLSTNIEAKLALDVAFVIHPEQHQVAPYGSVMNLKQLIDRAPVYLAVHAFDEDAIYSQLKAYIPHGIQGILCTSSKSPADVQRLHTILSVLEAEHYVADETLKILLEWGRYPCVANTLDWSRTTSRLAGIAWNEYALQHTLGADASREANGTLLPPLQVFQAHCLFAAKSSDLPCFDSAPQITPDQAGTIQSQLVQSTRLGFSGLNAILVDC